MTQENSGIQAPAMTDDDMLGMGMTQDEIEAYKKEQQPAAPTETAKETEDKADVKEDKAKGEPEKPADGEKAKPAADDGKKAEAETVPEDKTDKAAEKIKDMLFRAEREAKRKVLEAEIKKAREERRAKMTPEEIAAENEEVEAAKETQRLKDLEIFTLKQDAALREIVNTMDPDEYEIIAPDIKAFIASKAYDRMIETGDDADSITAEIIVRARGSNMDKLTELKIKKAEKKKEAETKVEDLKNFGKKGEPNDKSGGKSELEILEEKALTGNITSAETEKLIMLQEQKALKK